MVLLDREIPPPHILEVEAVDVQHWTLGSPLLSGLASRWSLRACLVFDYHSLLLSELESELRYLPT